MSKDLSRLIEEIKGERTLKQMEQDTGIDASVISKMIRGVYVPQKKSVYKVLSDSKTFPRANVSYEQLLEAALTSREYKDGISKVIKSTNAVLEAIGDIPTSALLAGSANAPTATLMAVAQATSMIAKSCASQKKNEKTNKPAKTSLQKFIATANGIIYAELGEKGLTFIPNSTKNLSEYFKDSSYTHVQLKGDYSEELLLRYIFIGKKEREDALVVESSAKQIITQLLFLPPNKRRKTSIVVNCREVYDYLKTLENKMSFKGNLSVILINPEDVCIEEEALISTYGDDLDSHIFFLK